jgi:hypothetical protein
VSSITLMLLARRLKFSRVLSRQLKLRVEARGALFMWEEGQRDQTSAFLRRQNFLKAS